MSVAYLSNSGDLNWVVEEKKKRILSVWVWKIGLLRPANQLVVRDEKKEESRSLLSYLL